MILIFLANNVGAPPRGRPYVFPNSLQKKLTNKKSVSFFIILNPQAVKPCNR